MSDQVKSEGAQLESVLAELQREHEVKDISGWRTGFANLDRALDGLLPGLYLLLGPSGCGKTSFARQLLDQVTQYNAVPAIFFAFTESKNELRIKTLSRLSEMESGEIRRGSAYLLHWYGVPRLGGEVASQLPASWEKLRRAAGEAKSWLDRVYLFECDRTTGASEIEKSIRQIHEMQSADRAFVVIDDCQYLQRNAQPLGERINQIADALAAVAAELRLPILAVASLDNSSGDSPWVEKLPSAAVIMMMLKGDPSDARKSIGPTQTITLQLVKNRGGERGALAFEFAPAFAKFAEK